MIIIPKAPPINAPIKSDNIKARPIRIVTLLFLHITKDRAIAGLLSPPVNCPAKHMTKKIHIDVKPLWPGLSTGTYPSGVGEGGV